MKDHLTQSGFDKFLLTLDESREQAGAKYELLRGRLIKFFEWRDCENAEELTDIVFDRIIRKINEGEQIQNVKAYAAATANFVFKEHLNSVARLSQPLDAAEGLEKLAQKSDELQMLEPDDERITCLRKCLAEFSEENRRLIIAYHDTDERTMIPARKRLADSLKISLNTLRIRVCRLKSKLEECTLNCCAKNR